jgi:hypothetical protein
MELYAALFSVEPIHVIVHHVNEVQYWYLCGQYICIYFMEALLVGPGNTSHGRERHGFSHSWNK